MAEAAEPVPVIMEESAKAGTLDEPEIYSEYAPYTYIDDMKEFIDKVSQLNRVA